MNTLHDWTPKPSWRAIRAGHGGSVTADVTYQGDRFIVTVGVPSIWPPVPEPTDEEPAPIAEPPSAEELAAIPGWIRRAIKARANEIYQSRHPEVADTSDADWAAAMANSLQQEFAE